MRLVPRSVAQVPSLNEVGRVTNSTVRNRSARFADSADLGYAARLSFSFAEPVDDAPDEFDALQKIVKANIFVWAMRIRSGVADAERRNRRRRR